MALQIGVQYGSQNPPATGGNRAILWANNATGTLWICKGGVYVPIGGGVANGSSINGQPSPLDPSGVPTSSGVLPPDTPVVTSLPSSGPLAVVGQYVMYNGQPYVYTTGIFSGPDYWALDVTGAPSIRDTFANLSLYPASSYAVGTVFVASDRNVSYAVQETSPGTKTWIYYNGIYENTLANIPAGLDDTSRGMYFRASDYLHNWEWTGSAWSLTAAAQSGFQGGLAPGTTLFANPGPPFGGTGALWHLCDGTTVDVSQEDGTVVATVLPTLANYWFVR